MMIQFVMSIGSWFVFFMIIEKMGERPLAVSNIIRSLYLFLMIPGWALGSVTSTMVSGAMGEGNPENVIPIILKIAKFSFLSLLGIIILAAFFPVTALSVYTNNASLVQATIPSYYIILGALFVFSIMGVFFSGVIGTANTRTSLLIEAITLAAYLGFTWLIAIHLKLNIEWVWMAEYVYFFLVGILSYWYLKKGDWRAKII
jgi:Na+-driven multidrug efflux pump